MPLPRDILKTAWVPELFFNVISAAADATDYSMRWYEESKQRFTLQHQASLGVNVVLMAIGGSV